MSTSIPDLNTATARTRVWPPVIESISDSILADRRGAVALAVGLVGLNAVVDAATGFEIRLAVLYLLPVFLATWTAGRGAGAAIAVLAALVWITTFRTSHSYSNTLYFYWDGAILFGTLMAFSLVVARLRRALDAADQRFETVLEGLDAAIYVNDTETGNLLYMNRRFRDYFPFASMPGGTRDFESRFNVLPADSPGPRRAELQERDTGRWFLVHARTVNWVDGRSVSLKVMADITAAKLAEASSRQQLERLQMSARLLTIGEIASGLAHELNQPLTAIAGYNQACLKLLRSQQIDSLELAAYMEKCAAQAVRAGSIVNRMREYARKREPKRGPNDINAIVHDAAQLLEVEAAKNGATIALELAAGLPPVMIDAIMIEQVLLNLIRNGIEAMSSLPDREKMVTVTSLRAGVDTVQLSVHDCGPGVPPELASYLFEPFVSTKRDGMGIGLNISRSIVEYHGGKIWHEPAEARGTSFRFTLPVAAGSIRSEFEPTTGR